MKTRILRRRTLSIGMLVALLASMLPFSGLAGSHEATRTEITFTSTTVEVLDEGEEWFDEAGIYHERGKVQLENVTGDISGTLTVTLDSDFVPVTDVCSEEFCPAYFTFWGDVVITGEDGGWKGVYVAEGSDAPDEEFYAETLVLKGTGANAHMSIVAQTVDEADDSTTFEGVLSTMAAPVRGLNTSVRLCADPEDFSFGGGFLSTGAIEGSGGASGNFIVGGGPYTHSYAVGGTVTLTDGNGSVTIAFGGKAQDNYTETFEASHVWGHFVVLDGTGDYAELYGNGRVIATAGGPMANCASGFGVNISMIGEAHYN